MQRILVVDDLEEVRMQLRRALALANTEVVEASDGVGALAAIDEGPIDVVVSDVKMPRMDGLELLQQLRGRSIPVILHSGAGDVAAAIEGVRLGAVDFFVAPIDFGRKEFLHTICWRIQTAHGDRHPFF